MGVALLVVSAVIWLLASTGETVEERDGTALLLTFPPVSYTHLTLPTTSRV